MTKRSHANEVEEELKQLKSQNAELIDKNARLEELLAVRIRELEEERAVMEQGRVSMQDMAKQCARDNRVIKSLEEENKKLKDLLQTKDTQIAVMQGQGTRRTDSIMRSSVLHSVNPSRSDEYRTPVIRRSSDKLFAHEFARNQAVVDEPRLDKDGFDLDVLAWVEEESKKYCGKPVDEPQVACDMPVDEPQTDDHEFEVCAEFSAGIDLAAPPPNDAQIGKIDTGLFDLFAPNTH